MPAFSSRRYASRYKNVFGIAVTTGSVSNELWDQLARNLLSDRFRASEGYEATATQSMIAWVLEAARRKVQASFEFNNQTMPSARVARGGGSGIIRKKRKEKPCTSKSSHCQGQISPSASRASRDLLNDDSNRNRGSSRETRPKTPHADTKKKPEQKQTVVQPRPNPLQ